MRTLSKNEPQHQAQYPQSAEGNFEKNHFQKYFYAKSKKKKNRKFLNFFFLSHITKQDVLCQRIACNDHKRHWGFQKYFNKIQKKRKHIR